ncbi:MAG: J domain-containing protein [Treponemataceae bacterium]|nr:J domain-containing protein [Treponemataceae bacterium]
MGNDFDKLGDLLKDYIDDENQQKQNLNVQNFSSKEQVKKTIADAFNIHDFFHTKPKSQGKIFSSPNDDFNVKKPQFERIQKKSLTDELINDFRKLGLEAPSSLEECKAAYKKLIKKYHPDNYLNAPSDYEKATKITISLTESLDRIKEWYSL